MVDWVLEAERQAVPWLMHLWTAVWVHENEYTKSKNVLIIGKGRTARMWLDADLARKNSVLFVSSLEKDSQLLRQWKTQCDLHCEKLESFCEKIKETDFFGLSDQALLGFHDGYYSAYFGPNLFVGDIRVANFAGLPELDAYAERVAGDAAEKAGVLAALGSASKPTPVLEQDRVLRNLALEAAGSRAEKPFKECVDGNALLARLSEFPELREKLLRHADEYGYLGAGFADEPPWTAPHFALALKELLSKKDSAPARTGLTREQVFEKYGTPEEIVLLSRAFGEFAFYKESIRSLFNYSNLASRGIFEEIASRLGLSFDGVRTLFPAEVTAGLEGGRLDEEALKRDCYGLEGLNGRVAVLSPERISEYLSGLQVSASESELRGTCANPGKAGGRVKIVSKLAAGSPGFEPGMILVSPMTTPDLVPLMAKAGAIVTDEGGLTSHAAIVSRELGVPCVVGTKVATQALKDGDVVEVDATKGVVRKVS